MNLLSLIKSTTTNNQNETITSILKQVNLYGNYLNNFIKEYKYI